MGRVQGKVRRAEESPEERAGSQEEGGGIMSGWIVCYRKTENPESASTVQINRSNVMAISLFSNRIEIEFVNGQCKQFYFTDWDIKL